MQALYSHVILSQWQILFVLFSAFMNQRCQHDELVLMSKVAYKPVCLSTSSSLFTRTGMLSLCWTGPYQCLSAHRYESVAFWTYLQIRSEGSGIIYWYGLSPIWIQEYRSKSVNRLIDTSAYHFSCTCTVGSFKGPVCKILAVWLQIANKLNAPDLTLPYGGSPLSRASVWCVRSGLL